MASLQWRRAIDEEAAELTELAQRLSAQSGAGIFDALAARRLPAIGNAATPYEAECALETFARELRRLWLNRACDAAHQSYRSPTCDQPVTTATAPLRNFGYERELEPTRLECRCARFFDAPPDGWDSDHILFSSGQAAMAATLHLAQACLRENGIETPTVKHVGGYYETRDILKLYPLLKERADRPRGARRATDISRADLLLIEPVFYDEAFCVVDPARAIERCGASVVIFDDTLTGAASHDEWLARPHPKLVARVSSALKLTQGGFELSNVGIVSLYAPKDAAFDAATRLRKIRALLGAGLRLSDVAGLEAPWFLDRAYTDRYRAALFAHNAALAHRLAAESDGEMRVFHPALDCGRGEAPYCIVKLAERRDYDAFAAIIAGVAQQRQVCLESGGSFGFRGHRFDVVTPEDEEPYLRIAMGRRAGWSCEEVAPVLLEAARRMFVTTREEKPQFMSGVSTPNHFSLT